MRTFLKMVLLTPLLLFGAFYVLRLWMSLTDPTPEEIRRQTQARTLADAVCRADVYSGPDSAMVARMIDQGGDVNQIVRGLNKPTQPLVLRAAWCNAKPIVELLIARGARVENVDLGDLAIRNGEMTQLLIEHGARLDTPWHPEDPKLGTRLIQAAVLGRQLWLVERLLADGDDVQIVNGYGRSLLALALPWSGRDDGRDHCQDHCIAMVRRLLAASAHVNPLNADEVPPLVIAAYDGDPTVVQMLLDACAKSDASMPSALLYPRHPLPAAISRILHGRATALSVAAYECNGDAVRALLKAGAPVPKFGVENRELLQWDICSAAWPRGDIAWPKPVELSAMLVAATSGANPANGTGTEHPAAVSSGAGATPLACTKRAQSPQWFQVASARHR
ncbi:MAG: hypothetical protein ABIQ70_04525 [Dokdonella sp.]